MRSLLVFVALFLVTVLGTANAAPPLKGALNPGVAKQNGFQSVKLKDGTSYLRRAPGTVASWSKDGKLMVSPDQSFALFPGKTIKGRYQRQQVQVTETAVQKRAFGIWERSGRPEGQSSQNYLRALGELVAPAR